MDHRFDGNRCIDGVCRLPTVLTVRTVLLGSIGEHLRGCTSLSSSEPGSPASHFWRELRLSKRDSFREAFETYIMVTMRIKESFLTGLEEYPRP